MNFKFLLVLLFFTLSMWAKERIVSLSPSVTEIVYALGAGEALVGTTSYSLYPKAAQKLPVIGSYVGIDIEKAVSLHPTLVIAQEFQNDAARKLSTFGIEILRVDLHSINSIESSILKMGKRLHREKKAKELVKKIESAKKNAKKSSYKKRVLVVFGLRDNLKGGIYVSGNHLFYDEILHICGDENAFDDPTIAQPVLNYEHIVALDHDAILILHSKASNPNGDIKRALHVWKSLPVKAARKGDIHIIDDDYIDIPSHRIALTIERICKEL